MSLARIASFVHKWLALIVGVQILLWIASGLFFTIVPIEQVRSEQRVRAFASAPLRGGDLAAVSAVLATSPAPVKLTLEARAEGDVVLAEYAAGSPRLFDAHTAALLSPLSENAARHIASLHITAEAPIARATWVRTPSPEYRGALPAWRLEFADKDHLAVYVAANTGQVTARRSDLWRTYDALWALHIMDWRDHENFNHGLIIAASVLALVSTIGGIVLIPYRFRWRRRRSAADA
ncbi:MAG: hypothetical protein HY054_11720 [Proteobacteria bacterium]|nr:hypothetical protein [Pseudomonadota bacterium]